LLQKDPAKTMAVTVGRDDGNLTDRVEAFVASFNDLVKFADQQATASNNGTVGAMGRDSVLRGVRNSMRNALLGPHGSGTFTRLAEVGIGFTRTGELTFDRTAFTTALNTDPSAVQSLFTDASTGAFSSIN